MATAEPERPGPAPDRESAAFWTALAEHRFVLQRCASCARHRFPPMPSCPWCGATGTTLSESSGGGEVYSWVTVHRAFAEAFAADVPYVVAAVELDEGCRVFGRVEVAPDAVHAGLAVVPVFVDHDDWTELRFAPAVR
jgi:uncharacterized OB-fold protein